MAKVSEQQVDVDTKVVEADELGTLIDWVNEADNATVDSRAIAEKSRDYYDSKQLDSAEIAQLKKRKQAPVVINRIKPKMDTLMGMEKAAKTTAKAYPRTPRQDGGAEAATEGIRYVLQDNHFDQIRSAVWENILIEGTGGGEVVVKELPSGEMQIVINHIMWDRLIYDPHSRRKDFKDARYLGQVVWMDYDEAVEMYPQAKDVLESMMTGSETYDDKPRWMDTKRRRVKIVELYYYKNGKCYYACFTRGGYCEAPKESPYKDEDGIREWPYEFASAFVDREGGRYGAVRQLLDVQDEINKRRSKALHLMSVRQVRLERGAVEDVNKTRQELAKPDGVVETTPGMEFEVLKTGDMAAAQFNLLTEAKLEIDAVGANAATQGKDTTVQSGRALIERRNAGQTEIGPMFDVLRYWQLRMFRKIWNRIRQYWTDEKWIRVTDEVQNLRFVGLNRKTTQAEMLLEQAKVDGKSPAELAMLKQQLDADPAMQQPIVQNDVNELDVDIVISDVPDVLTAQIEDFQTLGEMVKSGFQMPPEAVIEASPLSNKERILKLMKEARPQIPPEVQKRMEDMQKQMQGLAQENQKLKSGVREAGMKLQARMEEKQMEMSIDQRMEMMRADAEARANAMAAMMEDRFKRWEALLEAKTKIEVAEISKSATLEAAQISAANAATQESGAQAS